MSPPKAQGPQAFDISCLASQEQTPVRFTNARRYVLEQCVRNVLRSCQVSGGKAGSEANLKLYDFSLHLARERALDYQCEL